jgi:hypothetical protein
MLPRALGTWLVGSLLLLPLATTLPAQEVKQASRPRTTEQKIADAMSAAPDMISSKAAIMDWPETEGAEPKQLRAGTNGWVCFPTHPKVHAGAGSEPLCLDEATQAWAKAWMNKTTPELKTMGISYMLKGDAGASNTDPFATGKTADNSWVQSGPHIMIHPTDVSQLQGFNTDPNTGTPFVMWQGTPYAHIMVPVDAPKSRKGAAGARKSSR